MACIAHEFSNSLTLISGPCEQLLSDRKLIMFRKAENGHLSVKITPVQIDKLAGRIIELFRDKAQDSGVGLKTDITPLVWNTDRVCLEKILGIGLSLCKNLAEALGGSITPDSDGATYVSFTVCLPSHPVSEAEPGTIEAEPEMPVYEASVTEDSTPGKVFSKDILVVDDNAEIRDFISSLFRTRFNVLEAGEGEEALRQIAKRQPVLIISDVMMDGMDGNKFLRAVKDNPATRHIPFILLSAKSSLENQIEGIASELAVSKIKLYRKLKETAAMSPTEYIRHIRLENAARLLKTTRKTVQEIIYACGFSSKTWFYREFQKKFGLTPNEYRSAK